MGRWRRWSLKGIPLVLQSPIYQLHNCYVVLYVLLSPFPIICTVFQISAIFSSAMSCIVLYQNLVAPWIYQVVSMPKPAGRLALYSMLPSPHQERQN
jgi:hypothetical protein